MWKKAVCLLLCLLMPLTALAEESLLGKALLVAERVSAQADDETWMAMMLRNVDEEIRERMVGAGHDSPRLVVEAEVAPIVTMMLGTQLLTELGTETLAMCMVAEADTIFAAELSGAGVFVLLYDDASPILVTWTASNGAVKMRGLCLPYEDLAKCASAEEVDAWFDAHFWALGFREAAEEPFAAPASREADLTKQVKALTARMHAQAGRRIQGLSETLSAMIADWASGDMSEPWLIVRGSASLNEVADMLHMDDSEIAMSLVRRLIGSVPMVFLTQLGGTEMVAACSAASATDVFAEDGLPDVGLMLLLYRDAIPVVVSWYTENGAAQITSYYMPIDGLQACQTPEEVIGWLECFGLPLDWHVIDSCGI